MVHHGTPQGHSAEDASRGGMRERGYTFVWGGSTYRSSGVQSAYRSAPRRRAECVMTFLGGGQPFAALHSLIGVPRATSSK